MLDFVFRFLDPDENKRKNHISLVLRTIFVLNIAVWLYTKLFGDFVIVPWYDINGIASFILKGGFVLAIILFFSLWAILNGFVGYVFSVIHPHSASSIWILINDTLIPIIQSNRGPGKFVRSLFVKLGFIKWDTNTLLPGVLLIEFAKGLKRVFEEKETSPLITTPIDATLIVQFVLTYWIVVRPSFNLPFVIEVMIHLIALISLLFSLVLRAILLTAILHKEEIIRLIPDEVAKTEPSKARKGNRP